MAGTIGTCNLNQTNSGKVFYYDNATDSSNPVYRIIGDIDSWYPTAQSTYKVAGTGNSGTSYQGQSVALSADGSTLAVGGALDNGGTGAVWIFTRTNLNYMDSTGNQIGRNGGTGATWLPRLFH